MAISPLPFRPKLKTLLLQKGILRPDQVRVAEEEQRRQPTKLFGEILVDLKLISPKALQETLSLVTGFPFVNLKETSVNQGVVLTLPGHIWRQHHAIAFDKNNNRFLIAMADPENILLCDALKSKLYEFLGQHPEIQFYHADPQQIENAIDTLCKNSDAPNSDKQAALEIAESILTHAVRKGASDIHFQPEDQTLQIRCRIDGILRTTEVLHKSAWASLSVCLKVMANLDIAESRRPQSGRFDRQIAGHALDFRLSTHPTIFGENIVVRLLNKDKSLLTLDELGFELSDIDYLKRASDSPQGMIILSGPTGSGKTTTLYALFSQMDFEKRNIMTLEDPVEYQLSGIRQTEVREGGVMGFADGIRSILRQDPDVIFIGEIRDEETARMAVRSAMTGHLVIATLHANNCCSVPARLMDLGISPNLLSGNIVCAVAQRLVRKLCQNCAGDGCDDCDKTGFRGRVAVTEILPFDAGMDELISKNAGYFEIFQYVKSKGCRSLEADSLKKVQRKMTTAAEVNRVLGGEFFLS